MLFIVSVRKDGRVILDHDSHGINIQSILADDYEDARLQVDESGMFYQEGHGYFSAIH